MCKDKVPFNVLRPESHRLPLGCRSHCRRGLGPHRRHSSMCKDMVPFNALRRPAPHPAYLQGVEAIVEEVLVLIRDTVRCVRIKFPSMY